MILLLTLGAVSAAIHPPNSPIAAQNISSSASSSSLWFPSESIQLTDSVIANLNSSLKNQSHLFDFAHDDQPSLSQSNCKVFPGDVNWPSSSTWSLFDRLLGGALIKTVPLAASRYPSWPEYNQTQCKTISSDWTDSYLHAADPASVMWPLFEGRSCLPTSSPSGSCSLGGYPVYTVNVSSVAQIQLAVNFARNAGIRLVVKTTGHDFAGKSAGAGALGVWTHNLKDIQYLEDYQSPSYCGQAVKIGAGVQAFEVYEKAKELGFTAIGGEGKTVGVAGGYVLGGGHSPMSSMYGLAADQVLALEVVLPNGRFVTVTEQSDPDLFWAFRGGGIASYGIVTSIISRVYSKTGVTVSTFNFSIEAVSIDTFWTGVRAYLDHFAKNADAGTYAYFWVIAKGPKSFQFLMNPFFAVNHTIDEFNTLIKPCRWMTGSRLFPRTNFENPTLLNNTFDALKSTISAGHPLLAFNMKAGLLDGIPENSANPAFRNALMHAITSTTWSANSSNTEIRQQMESFTKDILGKWRTTCPESGAYISELDILEPNFQQAFYGTNYDRLYSLKQKHDPFGLFYAPTAVGSEDWMVKCLDGLPDQNGRLCRA